MKHLDVHSRLNLCEVFDWITPFLYEKSLISNMKITEICMETGFWRNFPVEKQKYIENLEITNLDFAKESSKELSLTSLKEVTITSSDFDKLILDYRSFVFLKLLQNNKDLNVLRLYSVPFINPSHSLNSFIFNKSLESQLNNSIAFKIVSYVEHTILLSLKLDNSKTLHIRYLMNRPLIFIVHDEINNKVESLYTLNEMIEMTRT